MVITTTALTQAGKWIPVQKIPYKGKVNSIYLDHLKNVYLVSGEMLLKYDELGKEVARYSLPDAGPITAIDVFNPMQIPVFYKDYNRIVFLDSQLNPREAGIWADEVGFFDVTLVSSFDENRVWLYDQSAMRLFLFNLNSQKTEQQSLLLNRMTGAGNAPTLLQATLNGIYLYVPGKGILTFDRFGAYRNTLPFDGIKTMRIKDTNLQMMKDGKLVFYNLETRKETTLDLPIEAELAYLQGRYLVCLKNNEVFIFTLAS